jgi:hypothetical protein
MLTNSVKKVTAITTMPGIIKNITPSAVATPMYRDAKMNTASLLPEISRSVPRRPYRYLMPDNVINACSTSERPETPNDKNVSLELMKVSASTLSTIDAIIYGPVATSSGESFY